MKRRLYEDYKDLFLYSFIAVFVGILTGAVDVVFVEVLIRLTEIRDRDPLKWIPFLPLAGMLILFLYKKLSGDSLKGMTMIFQTGHGDNGKIPGMLVPLVIFSTWLTHLFGGSAGREGVAVQIGAAIAHTMGRKLKFLAEPRILVVIGMAAGFSGLFQTPLAATFFSLEVLVSGVLLQEALLPALIASYAACTTSSLLGLEKFSVHMDSALELSPSVFAKMILLGIVFGIAGGFFAHSLGFCKKYFAGKIKQPLKRIFFMGCALSVILLVLHTGRYSGLGTNLIQSGFQNGQIYIYDWMFKFLLTILTLSAGFQGGEVTPLFSIGASLGMVLGTVLGLPAPFIAALGYAALFGSATNTLIAPIFIGAEVFGPQNTVYFVIVCATAYAFNGGKTIYSAQKNFSYFKGEGA
ncbi:chloride channel protein [Lachnospiraceae bacterium 54-53]